LLSFYPDFVGRLVLSPQLDQAAIIHASFRNDIHLAGSDVILYACEQRMRGDLIQSSHHLQGALHELRATIP
jgi:hypothetical protein